MACFLITTSNSRWSCLVSFWLKLNWASFEYSCMYKVNPFAPVRLLIIWVRYTIIVILGIVPVRVFRCLMCISDSVFICDFLFFLLFVCVRAHVSPCAAVVCMQIDRSCWTSHLVSSLMSSAVCGNENCWHSELWPLRQACRHKKLLQMCTLSLQHSLLPFSSCLHPHHSSS